MKKFFLGVFILFDLALIGGSAFVLYTYLSHRPSRATPSAAPVASAPVVAAPTVPSTAATAAGNTTAASAGQMTQTKIFSYRNSHAKHVAIRADFTGWKAEPMKRDAAGVWTYRAILSPGEYAYCYSVDDKPPLKDPVNKRTKVIGRAVVSAIVVEAAPPKSPK
jgi:hypothetical protein